MRIRLEWIEKFLSYFRKVLSVFLWILESRMQYLIKIMINYENLKIFGVFGGKNVHLCLHSQLEFSIT